MEVNIGLNDQQRQQIAEGLSKLLADTYTLYLKTHGFHWNVTGPHFASLHKLFEGQYMELFEAVDVLAERIRALGVFALGSYAQIAKLTSIKEEISIISWEKMVEQLVHGHEAAIATALELVEVVQDAGDEVTLNLLAERMDAHGKTAWMLRSLLA